MGDSARHRIDEILHAAGRVHEIVESMGHIQRITLVAASPNLDDMLDFKRSSAPDGRENRPPGSAA